MQRQYHLFYYAFIQLAAGLILAKMIYLSLVMPYISERFKSMEAYRADALTNALFATYTDTFDQKDHNSIADYGMRMIQKNPDLNFIDIVFHTKLHIVITADGWEQHQDHMPRADWVGYEQPERRDYHPLHEHHTLVQDDIVNYSRQLSLRDQEPINISLGIKRQDYQHSVRSLLKNIFIINGICILVMMLILFFVARRLQQKMHGAQQHTSSNLVANKPVSDTPAADTTEKNTLTYASKTDDINNKNNDIDLLSSIVEQGQDAIAVFDKKQSIKFTNMAFKEIVKDAQYGPIGQHFVTLMQKAGFVDIDADEIAKKTKTRTPSWHVEHYAEFHSSGERHFNIRFNRLQYPVDYYCAVMHDITQRKIFEKELNQLAFYDKLTKLPNRRLFLDRLEHTIRTAEHQAYKFALMFMDLDNFKHINDSLGHDYGDELLRAIATRLTEFLRQEDTVCRLGGDEFTMILNDIPDREKAGKIAGKIIKNIKKPYYIKKEELYIGVSVGVVLYPDDAIEHADLMKRADLAMYQAKRDGKNRFSFHKESNKKNNNNIKKEDEAQ